MDPAEFQRYFVKKGRFTAGTETRYTPSMITSDGTFQHLAKGFVIGMRFHSAPVVRLADARPIHLGHTIEADGRWRVFAFSGAEDPSQPSSRIHSLCDFLQSQASPVKRYTPSGADIDSVIDVRAIFQRPNQGKGAALRAGFGAALGENADLILIQDGDLEYDPADHVGADEECEQEGKRRGDRQLPGEEREGAAEDGRGRTRRAVGRRQRDAPSGDARPSLAFRRAEAARARGKNP